MAKKKPKINLTPTPRPLTGDLGKLFTTSEDTEQSAGMQLLALRLDAIQPDPEQPRRTFPKEGLQELADSIQQDGVIQPIEVTQVAPNQYLIVHGERRWRAAKLAGLDTIPAVVRRRDYDEVTRFVRQMVENIQREDLNDVDRAAGLLRLRELMQEELLAEPVDPTKADQPWARKITWAKVGKRLGHSRQRIHQLIQLLKLPDEIKEAVRAGVMTERDTRIYQGLKMSQQRALYEAHLAGELEPSDVRKVARYLKESPDDTVASAIRLLYQTDPPPVENDGEQSFNTSFTPQQRQKQTEELTQALRNSEGYVESGGIIPSRSGGPTSIDRLDWVRGHLARIQRQGLSTAERRELLRLLQLIQRDVASLLETIAGDDA